MGNKVIASFRDKFTKKVYKKGDSYTHKDEKRIAFLVEKGFLEMSDKVDEQPKKEEKSEKEEKPKKKSAKKADKE